MRIKKTPKFKKTLKYLKKAKRLDPRNILDSAGRKGVIALAAATPMDSGESANSWGYKIEGDKERYVLSWTNSAIAGSVPIVILLQYGHSTKSGYFLPGRDFINPALTPVYDEIESRLRQEVFG